MYITHSTGSSVANSCLTFCNPMDCRLPGSSVHGISQARVLEWGAIYVSKGSSPPRDQTHVSCIGRWILYHWAPREAHILHITRLKIGCSKIQFPSPSLSEGKYSWNKRTVLIKLAYLYVRHLIITHNDSFRKFLSLQFYWSQNSLEGIINLLKQ